jgi:hypothetical protein
VVGLVLSVAQGGGDFVRTLHGPKS